MSLHTLGNIIMFVISYIVVFWFLVQVGVYVALVGAVMATKWVLKNLT